MGNPLNFRLGRTLAENSGIIATNGHIHPRVLEVVKSVLAKKSEAVENGGEHHAEKPSEPETPQTEATVPAEVPAQPPTEEVTPQEEA